MMMPKRMLQYFMIFSIFYIASGSSEVFASQLKKTVAVSRFENRTGDIRVGDAMGDQLADALIQSGKFVVLERQTLSDIIGEQDLAASGRAAVSKSAETGKIIPAQILIKGTVTEFDSETKSGGTGISFSGVSLGSKKSSAHMAVILRIINTTTGEIIASERIEGSATGKGFKLGVAIKGVDWGSDSFKKTSLGKAMQVTIDRAVVKISKLLDDIPFQGKIIKVTDDLVYTNIGARNDLTVGDIFKIYSEGEALLDPDTGENLGSEKTMIGSIKISNVQEKFSKATIEMGDYFEKGFIVTK